MRIMDTISALKKVMIMNRFLSAIAFGIALIDFSTSGAMADTVLSTDPSSPTTLSFGDIGTFSNTVAAGLNSSDAYYFSISSAALPINAYIYAQSSSTSLQGFSLEVTDLTLLNTIGNPYDPSVYAADFQSNIVNGVQTVSVTDTLNPGDDYLLQIGYDTTDTTSYTGAVVTPVPASLPLFAAGLLGILALRRKGDKVSTSLSTKVTAA